MEYTLDLKINKGLDFIKTFRYKKLEEDNLVPQNLFQATVRMQIRTTPKDPRVLFDSLLVPNSLVITDDMNGVIKLHIPANVTSTFKGKQAVYDILVNMQDKPESVLACGVVEFLTPVTRD